MSARCSNPSPTAASRAWLTCLPVPLPQTACPLSSRSGGGGETDREGRLPGLPAPYRSRDRPRRLLANERHARGQRRESVRCGPRIRTPPFQPIHEDDLGACIARCFIAPANDLHAGVYSLYSTPPTSVVDLLERTAKHLSRWPKVRLHIPLFVILLGARLRRLTDRNRAWESRDRLGLLRCGLVAERNDLEALMGPACATHPLANALDEAATALGLLPGTNRNPAFISSSGRGG